MSDNGIAEMRIVASRGSSLDRAICRDVVIEPQRVYLNGTLMRNRLWLTVPQAVVLEVTRNLDLALSLTEDDPNLVVIIANRLTARPRVIPLESDSDEDEKLEARRQLHKDKDALKDTSRYTQGQQRVHQRLIAGLTAQASRIPGGPYEVVDPVEFTSVELIGVDAVSKRTGSVRLPIVQQRRRFKPGRRVRLVSGAFAGYSATVRRDDGKTVVLRMDSGWPAHVAPGACTAV
jgi:hypothetical protein